MLAKFSHSNAIHKVSVALNVLRRIKHFTAPNEEWDELPFSDVYRSTVEGDCLLAHQSFTALLAQKAPPLAKKGGAFFVQDLCTED